MNYHSLTPKQQDDVTYLFADECFQSDPKTYDYELINDQVVARLPKIAVYASRKHDQRTEVVLRADPHITDDQARCADAASKSLALLLVKALALAELEFERADAH